MTGGTAGDAGDVFHKQTSFLLRLKHPGVISTGKLRRVVIGHLLAEQDHLLAMIRMWKKQPKKAELDSDTHEIQGRGEV